MTLDLYGEPLPPASPTDPRYDQSKSLASSHDPSPISDALMDTFAQLNISSANKRATTHNQSTVSDSSASVMREKLFTSNASSPPTDTSAAEVQCGDGKTSRAGLNNTDYGVTRSRSAPHEITSEEQHGLNQVSGSKEPLGDISLRHNPPRVLADGQRNSSGFEIVTTAPTPTPTPLEPTMPPTTTAPQFTGDNYCNEDSNRMKLDDHSQDKSTPTRYSGVTESQKDALGSDLLSCGHIRRLSSSSSTGSTDSPYPSPEVDPVQVSEQSPGEYHPLASGGIEPAKSVVKQRRQRCKQCAKLKKESNALREELDKVQRALDIERDQNNRQVDDLKQQLHHQQQANYALINVIHDSELRHQVAERTIQHLQRELQRMKILNHLLEDEKAGIKRAYEAKCEFFRVELQRADSMHCYDSEYYENTSSVSHIYHKQTVPAHGTHDSYSTHHSQWQTPYLQASGNIPMNPHTL